MIISRIIAIFLVGTGFQQQEKPLDVTSFLQIITENFSRFQDIEFICEGTILSEREGTFQPKEKFQSLYAYRSDGSVYWDMHRIPTDQSLSFMRVTNVLLVDKGSRLGNWQQLVNVPDRKPRRNVPVERLGAASSLAYDGSPGRYVFNYLWHDFLGSPENYDYKFEGWEQIDGNNCARVTIDSKGEKGSTSRYWIDIKRNANVLKYEYALNNLVWLRVHTIILEKYTKPFKFDFWFPISAQVETFPDGTLTKTTPRFKEIYTTVNGSLEVNQSMTDKHFSLDWKPDKYQGTNFVSTFDKFREKSALVKTEEPIRNNPSQIGNDLDRLLAEADIQASRVSAAPSTYFTATNILQLVFGAFGLIAIIIFLVIKYKSKKN